MAKVVSVRSDTRRQELKFQGYILDSYGNQNGYARKWATDLQVGVPDIIASLPDIGVHLLEVKHRPEWIVGGGYPNPLDRAQVRIAREFEQAGALIMGAVIVGGVHANDTSLCVFPPLQESINLFAETSSRYKPGKGYDVLQLVLSFNYVYRSTSS